jgi:hypothetical protein
VFFVSRRGGRYASINDYGYWMLLFAGGVRGMKVDGKEV